MRCKDCQWWDSYEKHQELPADCRRDAPVLLIVEVPRRIENEGRQSAEVMPAKQAARAVWPQTKPHDFCGRFVQRHRP